MSFAVHQKHWSGWFTPLQVIQPCRLRQQLRCQEGPLFRVIPAITPGLGVFVIRDIVLHWQEDSCPYVRCCRKFKFVFLNQNASGCFEASPRRVVRERFSQQCWNRPIPNLNPTLPYVKTADKEHLFVKPCSCHRCSCALEVLYSPQANLFAFEHVLILIYHLSVPKLQMLLRWQCSS